MVQWKWVSTINNKKDSEKALIIIHETNCGAYVKRQTIMNLKTCWIYSKKAILFCKPTNNRFRTLDDNFPCKKKKSYQRRRECAWEMTLKGHGEGEGGPFVQSALATWQIYFKKSFPAACWNVFITWCWNLNLQPTKCGSCKRGMDLSTSVQIFIKSRDDADIR